ncbi:30S ribosomal protein S14 [Alphaproteobacteria bacterium]|nr:30S ribosomal protein S14 [Alphaproteobacteria bacterium]GHS95642.1 30S ribosomal protein S14 [Alphaproteobacteria bacterium]
MAKLSSIEKNKRRQRLIRSKAATRAAFKAIISKRDTEFTVRMEAVRKLAEMPRNSSSIRYRNRCEVSGRPRGVYRKFKMSRIALRDAALFGLLPGVTKASW